MVCFKDGKITFEQNDKLYFTLFYCVLKRNYSQESYLKLQQYGFLHKRPIWFCATSELLFAAALCSLAELFRDPTVHLTRPQMSTFFHHLPKKIMKYCIQENTLELFWERHVGID